jgi:hypothetical protein
VGKAEGKRLVRRPRRRRVDNIKIDLRETGWGFMDWIDLAKDKDQWRALVNTVMNLRVPYISEKFLSSCTIGSFSRRAQHHEVTSVTINIQEQDRLLVVTSSTLTQTFSRYLYTIKSVRL